MRWQGRSPRARTLLALLAVTWPGFYGCSSGESSQPWQHSDLFTVADVDGEALLVGLDVAKSEVVVAMDLGDELGLRPDATTGVVYGGRSGPVLVWSQDNEPLHFARIDPKDQRVGELAETRDTSLVASTRSGVVAILGQGDARRVESVTSPPLPTKLGVQPVAVAAANDLVAVVGGSSSVGTLVQFGGVGVGFDEPIVVSDRSIPGDVAVFGQWAAVTLNRAVPDGVTVGAKANLPEGNTTAIVHRNGRIRNVRTGRAPRLVSPLEDGRFAVEAMGDAGREVWIVDAANPHAPAHWSLPEDAPVTGVQEAEGVLVILQEGWVTFLDPNSGKSQVVSLPGPTLTGWRSGGAP